jgi:hypothetical protein
MTFGGEEKGESEILKNFSLRSSKFKSSRPIMPPWRKEPQGEKMRLERQSTICESVLEVEG